MLKDQPNMTLTFQQLKIVLFSYLRHQKNGLVAEFFDNMKFQGEPVFKRIDSNLCINGGMRANSHQNVPKDKFSVRWKGLSFPKIYRIHVQCMKYCNEQ